MSDAIKTSDNWPELARASITPSNPQRFDVKIIRDRPECGLRLGMVTTMIFPLPKEAAGLQYWDGEAWVKRDPITHWIPYCKQTVAETVDFTILRASKPEFVVPHEWLHPTAKKQ